MARDLRPQLQGSVVERVRVIRADILRKSTKAGFERALAGRTIRRVGRRAKHLVLELDDFHRVVIQPGMTGSVRVANGASEADAYLALEALLAGGQRLLYRDVRRLGRVLLLSPGEWTSYDARIGPEPLDAAFTPRRLGEALAGTRLAVKKAIMDQRRLAGVGNIYANEALWQAKLDPSRASAHLTTPQVARLHAAIVHVLARAIGDRGTTVRDYRTGTGEAGRHQDHLAVYGRRGEPCPRCGRRIALTHAIDHRATYFCPGCQR